MSDPKERLIRIMGTFDLATGHADTWDELLDSLELDLRDVLGHYREALKQHLTQEEEYSEDDPVAWRTFDGEGDYGYHTYEGNEDYAQRWDRHNPSHKGWVEALYTHPLKEKNT